ncbi:hypothetical protein [Microbacterium lacticum]
MNQVASVDRDLDEYRLGDSLDAFAMFHVKQRDPAQLWRTGRDRIDVNTSGHGVSRETSALGEHWASTGRALQSWWKFRQDDAT